MALRLAVDGDVSRGNTVILRDGERLTFGLADGQYPVAVLLAKLPVIKVVGLRLVVALGLRVAAQAIHPDVVFELERVARVLALVHLCEIVLRDSEIFNGQLPRR